MPIPPRIFLIGYRGTGKTTVAKLLAERLSSAWVDSDDLIEQEAGQSIAEIFSQQGEAFFRDLEEKAVAELVSGEPRIVSLGGGAILRNATRDRLRGEQVVWLKASPQVLAERLTSDTATADRRPSLTGQGVAEEIEQVLAVRTPIYEQCATIVVDTQGRTPAEVAEQIASRMAAAGEGDSPFAGSS